MPDMTDMTRVTLLVCPEGHTGGFRRVTRRDIPGVTVETASDHERPDDGTVSEAIECRACGKPARRVKAVMRKARPNLIAYLPVRPEEYVVLRNTTTGANIVRDAAYDRDADAYVFTLGGDEMRMRVNAQPIEITFDMASEKDRSLFWKTTLTTCPDMCGVYFKRTRIRKFVQDLTSFKMATAETPDGDAEETVTCSACGKAADQVPYVVTSLPGTPDVRIYMPTHAPAKCLLRDTEMEKTCVHDVDTETKPGPDGKPVTTLTVRADGLTVRFLNWEENPVT